MSFEKIFEPYTLRGLTLKNRLISAPCERNYANVDGSVTQQYIDYLIAQELKENSKWIISGGDSLPILDLNASSTK